MRGVHFTILLTSPCAGEVYEIWHTRSTQELAITASSSSSMIRPIVLCQLPLLMSSRHCTGCQQVSDLSVTSP